MHRHRRNKSFLLMPKIQMASALAILNKARPLECLDSLACIDAGEPAHTLRHWRVYLHVKRAHQIFFFFNRYLLSVLNQCL